MRKPKRIRFQPRPVDFAAIEKSLAQLEAATLTISVDMSALVHAMQRLHNSFQRAAAAIRPEIELQILKHKSWQRHELGPLLDNNEIHHDL